MSAAGTQKHRTIVAAAIVLFIWGCVHEPSFRYTSSPALQTLLTGYSPRYPAATFIVASDLHLYDPVLGTAGEKFKTYLENERKLLVESVPILETLIAESAGVRADFVLIPGDLTKDGERASHLKAAGLLARFEAQGKKVYVINGNHDIMNGEAFAYDEAGEKKTDTITASEFSEIYAAFGFTEASARDEASLSYAVEPVPGLVLLVLDACRYRENRPDQKHIVAGRFEDASLNWLEDQLRRAAEEKKAVIVMMHHGAAPHFPSQEKHFNEYLVEAWPAVSRLLAAYKARLVFSGHFHAQDIVLSRPGKDPAEFLFDIETGSLVTFPCPYRIVRIGGDNRVEIASPFIAAGPSLPADFAAKAEAATAFGLQNASITVMKKYGVPPADADTLAPQIVAAFMAHYRGDEQLPPGREMIKEKGLSFIGGIIVANRKELVIGLWQDPPPADNNVTIDLSTGSWEPR